MNASTEQEKLTSQWITSLAISVVCCAALFLVFAGYIVDLHRKMSETAIRVELLQEVQSQLTAELNAMRRPIPVMPMGPMEPSTQAVPQVAPQAVPPAPPAQPDKETQAPAPQAEPAPAMVSPAPSTPPAAAKTAPVKQPVPKQ